LECSKAISKRFDDNFVYHRAEEHFVPMHYPCRVVSAPEKTTDAHATSGFSGSQTSPGFGLQLMIIVPR
jgi:hypothetical protein